MGVYKKNFWDMLIIFMGTLLVLTMARMAAGENAYVYSIITFIWFIFLAYKEIFLERNFLATAWQDFKKNKLKNIVLIVFVVILLFVSIKITRPLFNQFIPQKELFNYSFSIDTKVGLLWNFIAGIINVLIAAVEEMAYRHQGMYVFKKNNVTLSIMLVVSSILFGFSHFYNFNGSFLATGPYIIAGLILGGAYLLSKNIWVPILAHVIFNSTGLFAAILLIVVRIIQG